MNKSESLGARVKRIRTAKGIGLGDLAKRAGMPQPSTLQSLEESDSEKTEMRYLIGLAKGLDITIYELVTGKEPSVDSEEPAPKSGDLSPDEVLVVDTMRSSAEAAGKILAHATGIRDRPKSRRRRPLSKEPTAEARFSKKN